MHVTLAAAALLLTAGQTAAPSAAQQAVTFDRTQAAAAVEALATALEQDFVDPDTGVAYARMLRAKLAAGAWNDAATPAAFAEAVTRDLHAIQYDGHLTLRPPQPTASTGPEAAGTPPVRPPAMEQAGWISDGVAYVRFNVFLGEAATLEALRGFLASHGSARTLIIDARTHGGGGLDEMDVLFPQLFDKPVTLVGMDMRESVEARMGPILDNPTLIRVSGLASVIRREHRVTPAVAASALSKARVFLLTSGRTASAAEHLALSLKRTGRATLIGETTAGAGNFGGGVQLPGGYSAFVPSGRTFDPDTGKGWDGTGIMPHVAVPAAEALTEALVRAGVARPKAVELSARYTPTGSMARRKPLTTGAAKPAA